MNRISHSIAGIRARLDSLDPAKVAALDNGLGIDLTEHFAFQEQQVRAHASGKLTTEEAQVVYMALGERRSSTNGGWATSDTATKVVVTQLMGELLAAAVLS